MRRVSLRSGLRGVAPVSRVVGGAVGVGNVAGRTQHGDVLGFGQIANPVVRNSAITQIWTESGVAGYTGEFASIVVTRTAGTELLFWVMLASDAFSTTMSDLRANGVSFYLGRNLYIHRDTTQRYRFFENLPMTVFDIQTNSPDGQDQFVFEFNGGCIRNFHFSDSEEISGSIDYGFTYKNNNPAGNDYSNQTDKDIEFYYVFMLERKKK